LLRVEAVMNSNKYIRGQKKKYFSINGGDVYCHCEASRVERGKSGILRQAQNERKEGLNIMEKTHVATRLQPRDHDLKRSWLHWGIYKGWGLRMTGI